MTLAGIGGHPFVRLLMHARQLGGEGLVKSVWVCVDETDRCREVQRRHRAKKRDVVLKLEPLLDRKVKQVRLQRGRNF